MCNCNMNYNCCCRRYGFFSFMGDCIMIFITFGFWLIWIFIREMRKGC